MTVVRIVVSDEWSTWVRSYQEVHLTRFPRPKKLLKYNAIRPQRDFSPAM